MQVIIQHRKHACITESERKEKGKKKDCACDYDRKIVKKKEDVKE